MLKFATPIIRTAAVAAFVGSFAFATPVHAQSTDTSQPTAMDQPADQDNDAASASTAPAAPAKAHGAMKVEQRIKTLHAKLKITAAQEGDWGNVAQTMRDNETTISQLIQTRHQNPASMTAVDDLQSYQQIAQAHADGLQKLTASFGTLYNEMSDAQKKNADEVFGTFEGRHGGSKHAKHHHHS